MITGYLDEYLNINGIADASCNGLQIEGKAEVSRIGLAVDFSLEAARKAKASGSDLLIVHHGLIWGGLKSITGITYERVRFMVESRIGLYAAHLPLDIHPEVGHNAELARLLDITDRDSFGDYKGMALGVSGHLREPMELQSLKSRIDGMLGVSSVLLHFGKNVVSSIGIVSGGGSQDIGAAIKKGLDLFLTGETSHSVYHTAKDAGINVIYAGHYATETVGLRALGRHLYEKFKVPVEWIELPTGY